MMEEIKNNVSKEWKEVKLGEVLKLKNGERPKINDYGIIPVYGANGIMGKTNDFLIDNDFTIIVGRVGASGEIHLAKGKVWISDNAIYSQSYKSKKIHLPFLFYLLTFKNLKQFATKTTHPIITQSFLKNLPILLPPLPEQQKIAEILSTVDSAIEKVNQAIEKTQRLKKGLMQELLTKGIGHNEFKDTEIGRIPKEWEVVRLGEVADLNRGRFAHRPRNDPKFYGGKIPFIQTGDINEANGIIKKYSQTLNEKGLKISKLFKKGTIVISIAGNIGDVGILDFDACFPDSIIGINPNDKKVDRLFLMFLLQEFKDKLNAIAPRSTQKNINLEILEPLKLPLPPLPEQQKIAEILSTVDKRLELLRAKKEKLERVKKGLMNDLLTGKRRVC